MLKISTTSELIKKREKAKMDMKHSKPLLTDYKKFNAVTHGIKTGQLFVIGARPGVGKTTMLINLISSFDKQLNPNEYILFISLEMTELEIFERLITVTQNKFNLSEEEALEKIKNYKLLIFDNFGGNLCTVDVIREIITSLKSEKKIIRSVFIDYFQILNSELKFTLEHEKLGYISQTLKQLAKHKKVSIVLLAQLKRTVDSKKTETPTFSDIKGTGAVEQDADIIAFLYDSQSQINKDITIKSFDVVKNRNGQLLKSNFLFENNKLTFSEIDNDF
ncbi:repb [Mycoplasmopsis maculosa]|uniref:Repb n=1 Tax=Mycoplasmopsis maculosa TaxID=114885 RepID=A0A449B4R9_9BACT|nr:DnaB-like helicase C-terminal domain-containing protein [Mycoplasmopsis maculosa]VEU75604.1 repb [Mycoplasmopsis maculosa]